MLTLFSIPKAFRGPVAVTQRNAVASWTRLQPRPEIILFGDDEGTADLAKELGLEHFPNVARNEYGTPLVNDIFDQAQRLASNDLLCYVNADIILMSDFMQAVRRLASWPRRFLMVGQRWDVDVPETLNFGPQWEEKLRRHAVETGRLHPHTGIDFFVFPRDLVHDFPPFAIGRPGWDNWFLYRARSRRAHLIDATPAVMAVHQNHDYAHKAGGEEGVFQGPEAKRGLDLAGGSAHMFTIRDATLFLTPRGLRRALDRTHLPRQVVTFPLLHPYLGFPIRLLVRAVQLTYPIRARLGITLGAG